MSKEILYDSYYKAVPVTLDAASFDNGIAEAGTLLVGDGSSVFDDRSVKVKGATASGSIDGVLMSDIDLSEGDATGSLVYKGTVWSNKVNDGNVTSNVKSKLSGITFINE